jgi:hypothetical protein
VLSNKAYVHDITYWAPKGGDGYNNRTYGPPQLLKGRWSDRNERATTPDGQEIISRSVVYLREDVAIDGFLYNGASFEDSPLTQDGALPIQVFIKVPDIRSVDYERRAIL